MDKTTRNWFDPTTVAVVRPAELAGWQSDEELVRLSGAPKGSLLRITIDDKGAIELRVSNADLLAEDMVRLLVQEHSGYSFHIVNAVFVLKEKLLSQGIGPRSVTIELEQARRLGYITKVRAWAVGDYLSFFADPPMRGYYVWPMMGFDAPIPSALQRHPRIPEGLEAEATLLDLLDARGGEAFWLRHGSSIHVAFDLQPGSMSWRRHRRYTLERNIEVNP